MSPAEWPDTQFGDVIIFHRLASTPTYTVGIVLVDGDLMGATHEVVSSRAAAERIAFGLVAPNGRVLLRIGADFELLERPVGTDEPGGPDAE